MDAHAEADSGAAKMEVFVSAMVLTTAWRDAGDGFKPAVLVCAAAAFAQMTIRDHGHDIVDLNMREGAEAFLRNLRDEIDRALTDLSTERGS